MLKFIMGMILGIRVAAGPVAAFHYFGHDPGADAMERELQQQERFQQEFFRQQQRLNQAPLFGSPC